MTKNFFLFIFLFPLFTFLFSIYPPLVEASWFKISSTPIIPVGPINSWDQNRVGSASIIFDGSIFKMWYEGYSGSNWRIGYATSSNGITWSKHSNYVVDILDQENNFNVHDPKVIVRNNTFKMWYAASNSSINNIHINYTESSNGIDWSSSLVNIMIPTLSWERDISFPYTIFVGNQYRMWYAARGSYNGSVTRWRIGYATSPDGRTWTKYPLPVLETQGGWEGADVANPSVLFDEVTGTYEMFYHGDHGIGRATSPDGIIWTRDPANPILTVTPETFDAVRVFNPYVLKLNGIYYLYYTGVDNQNRWQIGLATSEPIPTPTVSPTPTATPTPTLTPTATPTVTPTLTPTVTPTPPTSNSPIIIIPGLGASWNPKDIFSCDINSSGKWELAPYVSIYNRLIKTLTDNAGLVLNRGVYIYTYDWRQPLPKQAENFKIYLDNLFSAKPADTKVRLVGHSLGGLVIRSYLEYYPNSHRVLAALTAGTPHYGAVAAYPIWEKGEINVNDLLLQLAINQVVTHCRVIRTFILPQKSIPIIKFRNSKDVVQYLVPVIKQLLPTFDYLKENGQIKPVTQLKAQNDWVKTHPFPQNNYDTSFTTLSGENVATLRYFNVSKPTIREQAFGDWIDGKPTSNETSNAGDGTVLNLSSQITGVNNQNISGNHTEIISSDTGITKILDFLGLSGIPIAPAVAVPEETSESALTVALDQDAQIKITDPKGNSLEGRKNLFVAYKPLVGLYKLEIIPNKTSEAFLHFSQITRGEEPQTKSFALSLTKNSRRRFYLIYRPNTTTPVSIIPI